MIRAPHSMRSSVLLGISGLIAACVAIGIAVRWPGPQRAQPKSALSSSIKPVENRPAADIRREALRERRRQNPRSVELPNLTFWWDGIPQRIRMASSETGPTSNIHANDYIGPQACQKCHPKNYEQWWQHPHRRMNALATEENVLGDFTGSQQIKYLGGEATFFRDATGGYRMKLVRDGKSLLYEVRQTIGSRFFQYYIGRLLDGAAASDAPYRLVNHVLPFGYWLDQKQWVPVVHVSRELPDGEREDPFVLPTKPRPGVNFIPYASNCSMCHTTFPLADDFTRKPEQIAKHVPLPMHWHLSAYLRSEHPQLWGSLGDPLDVFNEQMLKLPEALMSYEADEHAVTLGISCEACHLGCQQHASGKQIKPDFLPRSPYLRLETASLQGKSGRTHQNVNWVCARCHVGERPRFAGGMSTWNSVEYSDAMRGSCYSQLKCVDCHSPHQATGTHWPRTPNQDDASCIRCHTEFQESQMVIEHTHHPLELDGSRCMNCHMPRINEGLQSVVRTHTIFSPTNAAMLEANHPNACNQCHVDKPIDWTLKYLRDWYGRSYSEPKIAAAYPQRDRLVAAGWLSSSNEAVRLVAVDSILRANAKSFLPELIDQLDDPFLINRQFTQHGLEEFWQIRPQDFGYEFFMSPAERRNALSKLRDALLHQPSPELPPRNSN